MENLPERPYYKPQQIAVYFNVHVRTVYGWISEGKIEAVKVGGSMRIPRQAVKAFARPAVE